MRPDLLFCRGRPLLKDGRACWYSIVLVTGAEEYASLAAEVEAMSRLLADGEWGSTRSRRDIAATAELMYRRALDHASHDLAALGADQFWIDRFCSRVEQPAVEQTRPASDADVIAAINLARLAMAEAAVAVASNQSDEPHKDGTPRVRRQTHWGEGLSTAVAQLRVLRRAVVREYAHVVHDKPRSLVIRLIITLGISLGWVAFYRVSDLSDDYDTIGGLALYLFSAVVGSVVCTNALCFDAVRVKAALSRGVPLWRILVAKNVAMLSGVVAAGCVVIAALAAIGNFELVVLLDQLVATTLLWLGVGNLLSVAAPLRQEPFSERLRDGTWKPYLMSFGISYGVGLGVSLMVYWRVWARSVAAETLSGGDWLALILVLASAVLSYLLITSAAVNLARTRIIRRALSEEMIDYRTNQQTPITS